MDAFFRKLQEVTELPGEGGMPSGRHSAAQPGGTEGAMQGGGTMEEEDVEALMERLEATQRELTEFKDRWSHLRNESTGLQEEYAAYKAKVQTWREQMRVARAQDRKTIELLRQTNNNSSAKPAAGSSGTGGGEAGAEDAHGTPTTSGHSSATVKANAVEEVYVKSLEEQVKHLKESIRQSGEERNTLRIELKRTQDQHREELVRLATQPQTGSLAVGQEDGGATPSTATASPQLHSLQLLLESKELEVRQLQSAAKDLEAHNEQLIEELRVATDANATLTEQQQVAVQHATLMLDQDRQVQYIRSLESEVRMWKAEAQAARSGLTPMADDADTGSSAQTLSGATLRASLEAQVAALKEQLLEETTALRAQLDSRDCLVHDIRNQIADLSVESSLREESLDRMFNDCRELEYQLASSRDEAAAARAQVLEWQLKYEASTVAFAEMRRESEELCDRLSASQAQHAKLSKEHSQLNEMLRVLKVDFAKRLSAGSDAQTPATGSASSDGGAAPDGAAESASGATGGSLGPSIVNELAQLLHHRHLQSIAVAQAQVHRVWTQWSSKRKALWASSRWRMYVLMVLFIFLVLLFSLYQAVGVIEVEGGGPVALEEALRACHEQLKASLKPQEVTSRVTQ